MLEDHQRAQRLEDIPCQASKIHCECTSQVTCYRAMMLNENKELTVVNQS